VKPPASYPNLKPEKWSGPQGEQAQKQNLGVTPIDVTSVDSLSPIGDGKEFKWVLTLDGKIVAVKMTDPRITHTMASDGNDVKSAGWAIIDGKNVKINNRSGHYQCGRQSLLDAKKAWEEAGFTVEIVDEDDIGKVDK
jgi:hypothetical protein